MPAKHHSALVIICLLAALVSRSAMASDKLVIYTVNYPLKYFAERIAGDQADVVLPLPADIDPAFWRPDAETVRDYQQADLILLNGANYAKWVGRVSLPQFRLVNTSASFSDAYISLADEVSHRHGPGGEHMHAGIAFTTWIDFSQAAAQARAILAALQRERPASEDKFQRNYAMLEEELMALDSEITTMVASGSDQTMLASHPVYQYFARRYKLTLQSLVWESDEVPGENQWEELRQLAEKTSARWMIWEAEPNPASVGRLEDEGVGSLVFDPCANMPGKGDFMSVMRSNISRLKAAFP